ncbi:maleylacetoacetate isomerase [Martelella soudanensis]|uniref:maleylacetoacetate isomerase n=1 Tax=unclassified Martelella TaxID=2629616 RepID=UPI0015DFC8B8|nr:MULTISPECIES: maleylacetoacetate isomerase [unclassified Martelella]
MITLYDYWRSSASYRVRISLGLANLEWKTVSINLVDDEQKGSAYLARNPQGLVPAIEIDGNVFTQSLAIIEYLDETRGLNLLSSSASARARIRTLAYAIAMDIHPVCNLGPARHAVSQSDGGITMESWMQSFIGPGLAAFEAMLDDGDYCHGTKVSLADICLMPQLYNAHRWGVPLDAMPKIRRVEAHLSSIPAFSAAHPDDVRKT